MNSLLLPKMGLQGLLPPFYRECVFFISFCSQLLCCRCILCFQTQLFYLVSYAPHCWSLLPAQYHAGSHLWVSLSAFLSDPNI